MDRVHRSPKQEIWVAPQKWWLVNANFFKKTYLYRIWYLMIFFGKYKFWSFLFLTSSILFCLFLLASLAACNCLLKSSFTVAALVSSFSSAEVFSLIVDSNSMHFCFNWLYFSFCSFKLPSSFAVFSFPLSTFLLAYLLSKKKTLLWMAIWAVLF